MTDYLIKTDGTSSGLTLGSAISDTDALEVQQAFVAPATTKHQTFAAIKTWIQGWITKTDVGLGNVSNVAQVYSGSPTYPFYGDANTGVGPLASSSVTGSLTLTNQRLYMVPFIVPETKTFVGININVVTREAGKGVRLGIYNANQSTRQPTTLIVDGGVVDLDTTTGTVNRNTKTISQQLTPGLYYFAALSNGGGTAVITGANSAGSFGALGMSLTSGGTISAVGALILNSQTYQAFATALSDVSGQTFTITATNYPFFVLN